MREKVMLRNARLKIKRAPKKDEENQLETDDIVGFTEDFESIKTVYKSRYQLFKRSQEGHKNNKVDKMEMILALGEKRAMEYQKTIKKKADEFPLIVYIIRRSNKKIGNIFLKLYNMVTFKYLKKRSTEPESSEEY